MKTDKLKSRFHLALLIPLFIPTLSFGQYDSIQFGGYNRTYLLHLPAGYSGTDSLPLVIAMHGGFGSSYNIQNQSQLSIKADAENFIVVYPEGVKGGFLNASSWNAGWCCGFASSSNIDDLGFIGALLDTLIKRYTIDTNRIYATGMSNGGFMSYRLACELSGRIAAIAPVAASMSMNTCDPVRPVPIISFHSYLDTHVPYSGGIGEGPSNHYNPPQDSVLNAWANKNACAVSNDTIINNAQYTFIKWSICECGSEILQFITHDGGHSWPGGVQTPTGDPTSDYINATDSMWVFFQQHPLRCDTLTAINEPGFNSDQVPFFPNPTRGKLQIPLEKTFQKIDISVFTLTGQKILTVYNQTEIDINQFAKGTYLIQINIDGKIKTGKIVKTE